MTDRSSGDRTGGVAATDGGESAGGEPERSGPLAAVPSGLTEPATLGIVVTVAAYVSVFASITDVVGGTTRLFGVVAAGIGALGEGEASIAFFVLLQQSFPDPVVLAVTLVAVLLVTSSADTLFNAIASLVTSDLPRVLEDPSGDRLTAAARGFTGGVAYNDAISRRLRQHIVESGYRFLAPETVPPGDGGIAYGQAVVATARRCGGND